RRERQRHRTPYDEASGAGSGGTGPVARGVHLSVRGPHGGYRTRPRSGHGRRRRISEPLSAVGTDLGESARAAERASGRHSWLPYHHGHPGPVEEASFDRQRSDSVFAGNRQDVL